MRVISPTSNRNSWRLLPLASLLLLAGCSTLAPDYQRPDAPVPQQWPEGKAYAANSGDAKAAAELPWQDFIRDQRLQTLISMALDNNRDLRQTLEDVQAARASYLVQRGGEMPTVNAGLSASRSKVQAGTTSNSAQATVGMSAYEIDLFGKNRSLTEAERQSWLASEETARAARITLIGEITSAWLTLAADRNLLTLAEQTAENARQAMEITRKRLEMGVDSRVDLSSAETTWYSAKADIASYTTQVAQDRNALWLLVGQNFDDSLLPTELPASTGLLADIPAGLQSDVLLQRPDVLAAEHSLQSANASIGAAKAERFPSLSLTATGGLASSAMADIFTGGASTIWTLAPSLSMPIFDGGSSKAQVAYSEAEYRKAVAAWEGTVQSAFAEVADALARRGTIQQQLDAETSVVSAAQRSYDLSLARYQNGIDSFNDALDSQRTLYSSQQGLINTRLEDLDNRVTLYRVLGGGLAEPNTTADSEPAAAVNGAAGG